MKDIASKSLGSGVIPPIRTISPKITIPTAEGAMTAPLQQFDIFLPIFYDEFYLLANARGDKASVMEKAVMRKLVTISFLNIR